MINIILLVVYCIGIAIKCYRENSEIGINQIEIKRMQMEVFAKGFMHRSY
jgi:hypothetical protein